MATLLDEIAAALTELGVLAEGETPNAKAAADAFRAANRMLDQWAAESLQFFLLQRTVWTITPGTSDYTVGLLQTINAPRPASMNLISQVNILDSSTTPSLETPLTPLSEAQWAAIPQRTLTNTLPYSWYYDPLVPNGRISVFPVPTSTTLSGVLYAPKAISAFAAVSDTITLPPGYEEMLVTNLAVKLAASYERQLPPDLVDRAREAKAIVKRNNSKSLDMSFSGVPFSGGGVWSIYTDGRP